MSHLQIFFLALYGLINLVAFVGELSDLEGKRGRAMHVINEYVVEPYRRGIIIGNIFLLFLIGPALLSLVLLFGTIPGTVDVFTYIMDIRLTKPRPKVQE